MLINVFKMPSKSAPPKAMLQLLPKYDCLLETMTAIIPTLETCYMYAIFTVGLDIVIVVYYAIVAEPIVTIAHVCAIGLGVLLWEKAVGVGKDQMSASG